MLTPKLSLIGNFFIGITSNIFWETQKSSIGINQ